MSMGGAFRSVTQLLEHWESRRWDVASVDGSDAPASDELTVDVELRTPLHEAFDATADDALGLRSATIDDDGTLRLDVAASAPLVPPALRRDDLSVAVERTHATAGDLVVVVSVRVPTSDGDGADDGFDERTEADSEDGRDADGPSETVTDRDERAGDGAEDADGRRIERRNPDVPAFDDHEYLAAVYDACDTFAEMAEEIDMDVTAETVRRYMTDAGVHEPTSYDTGGESGQGGESDTVDQAGDGDEPAVSGDADATAGVGEEDQASPDPGTGGERVVLADGVGLPDGLSVDEFIEVIQRSRTLYEVQQRMDVERETARGLLREHNLLDLVVGQLAMESHRNVTRDQIIERLRASVSA